MRRVFFLFTFMLLLYTPLLFAESGDSNGTKPHEEGVDENPSHESSEAEDEEDEANEGEGDEIADGEEDEEKKPAKPTLAKRRIVADPRGAAELTICSQNLNNYGSQRATSARLGIDEAGYLAKEKALIQRFARAKCDVIAVQEILARNDEEGKAVLKKLADHLRKTTGRAFELKVGTSNEALIRNGFLVAKDRAEITNSLSYSKVELPKISDKQKPRFFLRSPYEIQITANGLEDPGVRKAITLINFHLKSKAGAAKDPVELEWETYRMEMAEAIRRIIEVRHRNSLLSGDNLLVVLGDRNSHFDTASAKILEGSLRLSDFKAESFCRLSKRGAPLCKAGAQSMQTLFSVMTGDPQIKLLAGTYIYKNVYSWLDDILLPAESLPFAWAEYDKPGDYASGMIKEPKEASDHALIYVRLNW